MTLSRLSVVLLAALSLAGCETASREPLPYSVDYSRVGTGPAYAGGAVRKGYDVPSGTAAGTGALVPDACITPDVSEQPLYLPPGCANNLNLQLMTERQSDLLHGRRTGPAMAAPVARAARRVIDGEPTNAPNEAATRDGLDTTGRVD